MTEPKPATPLPCPKQLLASAKAMVEFLYKSPFAAHGAVMQGLVDYIESNQHAANELPKLRDEIDNYQKAFELMLKHTANLDATLKDVLTELEDAHGDDWSRLDAITISKQMIKEALSPQPEDQQGEK